MQPLVIAYHLIWTGYGWWLPNDPRGSISHFIRNDVLKQLGTLHPGRKRLQPSGSVIRDFHDDASTVPKHSRITFDQMMIDCIARAFAAVMLQMTYTCYACAIMPDHVHLIIRKHKHLAEEMIGNLQRASHLLFREEGLIDMQHPIWGGCGWKVFLDEPSDIWRTIDYVRENPVKIGEAVQK